MEVIVAIALGAVLFGLVDLLITVLLTKEQTLNEIEQLAGSSIPPLKAQHKWRSNWRRAAGRLSLYKIRSLHKCKNGFCLYASGGHISPTSQKAIHADKTNVEPHLYDAWIAIRRSRRSIS